MASEQKHLENMTCEQASVLMACLVADDPGVTAEQEAAFSQHLMLCPECAAEYEDCQEISRLIREHGGPISQESSQLLAQAGYPVPQNASGLKPLMSVEEGWRDLLRRCPDLAEAYHREQRQQSIRRMFRRIGKFAAAMAACLALVILGDWLMNGYLNPTSPSAPQGCAELMTGSGRQALVLGQPVETQDQHREILLGGMHRVVMNQNTAVTFNADSQGHYQVQLAQGELYVEVVPGHPFTVITANARLDITGTQFNVKAQQDKTELTLVKGSVRFTSLAQEQAIDVKAGYASAVVGQSAPTSPAAVDAMATTAWTRDAVLSNAVVLAGPQLDAGLQEVIRDGWRQPTPADPDTLDYAVWRDVHRDDCARQFVWAIKAEQFLHKKGIQADWIELLMVSGDVWQFHYNPMLSASRPLTKIEPIAVARLARHFGVDEREMFRAVGLPDSTPIPMLPTQNPTPGEQYADALRRWHDALLASMQDKPEGNSDLMLFSLGASRYLATTRTAAYLWAKTHPQQAKQLLADVGYRAMLPTPLATNHEDAWLKQLREQAVAARSSAQVAMEWLLVPAGNGCISEATEHQRKLAALVAELLPPSREGKERGEGSDWLSDKTLGGQQ